MKDVMIDIETLGSRNTSLVVQIGACYFDRETGEIGNSINLNIGYGKGEGLRGYDAFTTDFDTIIWWMSQPEATRELVFGGERIRIGEAVNILWNFLQETQCVWSHATFDIPILENLFKEFNLKFPVPYRGMRDIRTLMDLADLPKSDAPRDGTHHNALDDCKYQVKYCVEAMQHIKHGTA